MSKVFPVRVTRTVEYTPESYIECCKEFDDEPTQEGFERFIQEWIHDDFEGGLGQQAIKMIES